MADNKLYKVAITLGGKYVHGHEYDKLVQVFYDEADGGDGCSYVSKKRNVNVRPGTDDTVWQKSTDRGIQGETGGMGPQGIQGEIGLTPNFSIGTVATGDAGSQASATITGTAENPILNLTIPQGIQGHVGPVGVTSATVSVSQTTGTPSATIAVNDGVLSLSLSNIKGEQGNSGYSGAAEELEVVNNVTDGGSTAALSAEMGKHLNSEISQLDAELGEKVTYQEARVTSATWTDGNVGWEDGHIITTSSYQYTVITLGAARYVRFLGNAYHTPSSWDGGYAFYDENDDCIVSYAYGESETSANHTQECIVPVPAGAVTFKMAVYVGSSDYTVVKPSNWYCYLRSGYTVSELIDGVDDVKRFVTNVQTIDVPSLNTRNYQIKVDTLKYTSTNTYKHCIVPITPKASVKVLASGQGSQIAWLTSNATPVAGDDAPLVPDTEVIRIGAYEEVTAVAPEGAKYLYIYRGSTSGYPWTPSSVSLTESTIPDSEKLDYNSKEMKFILNFLGITDVTELDYTPNWYSGFIYYNNGTIGSSDTAKYTQKISTGGKKYLFFTQNVSSGTGKAGLAFYDENGDYVSGIRQVINAESTGHTPLVAEIPATADSFRATLNNASVGSWFCFLTDNPNIMNYMVEGEEISTEKGDFMFNISGFSDVEKVIVPGWYDNKFINYSDGHSYGNTGLSYTYLINTNGKKYLLFTQNVSTGTTGMAGLAFYDEDGAYVSGSRQFRGADVAGYKTLVVTIPNTATSFRATIWTSQKDNWFGYLTNDDEILNYDPSNSDGTIHLKIGLFGNSYTADCWRYVPKMLLEYGITMESYFYYRGSGSLYDLDTQWTHDSATDIADIDGAQHVRLAFYCNTKSSPAWSTATRRSASDILDLRQWDIISLQQGGNRCKDITSYSPSLQNIIDKIETQAPYPKTLCWFMAYNGSTQNVIEGANQESLDAQKIITKTYPFNMIIPAAAAVFDAQQNETLAALGDSSYHHMYASDGTHMQEGLPAYVGACTVVQAILNKFRPGMSVLGDQFRATAANISDLGMSQTANGNSTGVSDANCYLAQKAAIIANNSPFEIIPV